MECFKKCYFIDTILIFIVVGLFLILTACRGESKNQDSGDGPNTVSNSITTTSLTPTTQPYDRDLYKHWVDADGDCQNTRHEVLIAESTIPVTFKTENQCTVIAGRWEDPFTGEVFTDPSDLDVDHVEISTLIFVTIFKLLIILIFFNVTKYTVTIKY